MTSKPAVALRSTEGRFGLVVLLIVGSYCLGVVNLEPPVAHLVLLVQIATVWMVFQVAASDRGRRVAGVGLAVATLAAVAGLVLPADVGPSTLDKFLYCLNIVLYLVAPLVIIRSLFRRSRVDAQTLFGAVAAYLLIGMMFAFSYRALGAIQASDLYGAQGDGQLSDDLFFSFVTLTTTGYGNLVPATNPGQSLAVLESILGQLFLVTALAKIVNDWRPRSGALRPPPAPAAGGPEG